MQEINVSLFKGAYAKNPKGEQHAMLLAAVAVVLQVSLLAYLAVTKQFTPLLVLVFLLNLLIPAWFFFNIWLDRKPKYRRHLTLTENGVCYRSSFMQQEQEFDWAEVDTIELGRHRVVFTLKNEEVHSVNLVPIQNDAVLRQVQEHIIGLARLKEVQLH